jgi:hypothetical protein
VHFYGLREAYGNVDTYFDGSMAKGYYMNDDRLLFGAVHGLPAWDGVPAMFQFHLMSAHALGRRQPQFQSYSPAANYAVAVNQDDSGAPSQAGVNFYDNGVRQADSVMAELLHALNDKGYLRNALVVITADHGELLGEHRAYGHAKGVYEEVLRVPLLLMSFGYKPSCPVGDGVRGNQVDIAPTILAELGMPLPATWSGAALQEGRSLDFAYFQQAPFAGAYDWRGAGWKYAIDMRSGQETVAAISESAVERQDAPPPELLRQWRAQVMPTVPGGLRTQ